MSILVEIVEVIGVVVVRIVGVFNLFNNNGFKMLFKYFIVQG